MEQIFMYIDFIMLALAVILALVYTIKTVQQATAPLRKIPLFFVVFGASAIVAFMFGHLFEIGTRAVQRVIEGNFVYDYRFYSLMLMGTVFITIGIYMLSQIKAWSLGDHQGKRNFLKAVFVLILLSAPTFPFTPIGLLPTTGCMISLAGLPFAVKRIKVEEFHLLLE